MAESPTIQDFMSNNVHTIGQEQNLEVALERMEELGVRHLPVLHGGKLVGLLSLSDVQFIAALDQLPLEAVIVDDAMSQEVYTTSRDAPLAEVAREMSRRHIGSAVVMEKDKPVGIFTAVDGLRALGSILP